MVSAVIAGLGTVRNNSFIVRRNVLDHLTDEQKPLVARKLNAAYALEDYAAKQALNGLHRELMDLNPSAAPSLGKGLSLPLESLFKKPFPPRGPHWPSA